MQDHRWQTQFFSQVIHIGFGSPILFDIQTEEEMFGEGILFPDSNYTRGDLFHHVIHQSDIITRALSSIPFEMNLDEDGEKKLLELLEFISFRFWDVLDTRKERVIQVKELVTRKLPNSSLFGYYHVLQKKKRGGNIEYDIRSAKDLPSILGFLHIRVGRISTADFSTHSPESYYDNLSKDSMIGKYFINDPVRRTSTDSIFIFSTQNTAASTLFNMAKNELEIEMEGTSFSKSNFSFYKVNTLVGSILEDATFNAETRVGIVKIKYPIKQMNAQNYMSNLAQTRLNQGPFLSA